MKKTLIVLIIMTCCACPLASKSQKVSLQSQRDSLQELFNASLVMLDSLAGNNFKLTKQIEKLNIQVATLQKEINKLSKEKNETTAALTNAKKIIADQNITINKLEAELKRLTQAKKTQ